MISETKRRILTAALGECWHEEYHDGRCSNHCQHCGLELVKCSQRTFDKAQDWEDLLEKVVRSNEKEFYEYLNRHGFQMRSELRWWWSLSIDERNLLVHDFCIYMYQQGHKDFQWVADFLGKEKG